MWRARSVWEWILHAETANKCVSWKFMKIQCFSDPPYPSPYRSFSTMSEEIKIKFPVKLAHFKLKWTYSIISEEHGTSILH